MLENKRVFRIVCTCFILLVNTIFIEAKVNEFQFIVNDVPVTFDQKAVIEEGRILVPLRTIFEVLGARVVWNQENSTIYAYRSETSISLKVGVCNAKVNDKKILLDVPPKNMNGSIFVPMRFVAESLGAEVDWDKATGKIVINDKLKIDKKKELINKIVLEEFFEDINNDGEKEKISLLSSSQYPGDWCDKILKIESMDGEVLDFVNAAEGRSSELTIGQIAKDRKGIFLVVHIGGSDGNHQIGIYDFQNNYLRSIYEDNGESTFEQKLTNNKLILYNSKINKKYSLSRDTDEVMAGRVKGPFWEVKDFNNDGMVEVREGFSFYNNNYINTYNYYKFDNSENKWIMYDFVIETDYDIKIIQ